MRLDSRRNTNIFNTALIISFAIAVSLTLIHFLAKYIEHEKAETMTRQCQEIGGSGKHKMVGNKLMCEYRGDFWGYATLKKKRPRPSTK